MFSSIALTMDSRALRRRNNSSYSRYGGGGGGMRLWFDPTDILWYWDPFYYQRRRERRMRGEGMSFVESIFSFVFGDGDPNVDFEERRWQAVRSLPSGYDEHLSCQVLSCCIWLFPCAAVPGSCGWDSIVHGFSLSDFLAYRLGRISKPAAVWSPPTSWRLFWTRLHR